LERAKEVLRGVPQETRGTTPDGATRYMRPRPGAARMYPETDIPPTQITEDCIRKIGSHLPELPEQKLERLIKENDLNQKLAKQVLDSEYSELFETIVKESTVSPTTVAAFMTESLKALKRDGIHVDNVSDDQVREIFKLVGAGKLMKEAISDVVTWLSKNEEKTVEEAISQLGFKTISENELRTFVRQIITENREIIQKRGEGSFSFLMGIVMSKFRGRVDATLVSKVLREKLKESSK
jgi:glutamyl-tRNA(Gln) amidotransferase subunit E